MSFIGIHASLIYIIKKIFPKSKLTIPILIGLLILDLEIYLLLLMQQKNTSFMLHNIFAIMLIYLAIKILKELSKKEIFNIVSAGVLIGMLIHIIIDAAINLIPLIFFWPILQVDIALNLHDYTDIFNNNYIYVLNFLAFRFLGWILIEELLLLNNISNRKSRQIQNLSLFIKIQLYYALIASISIFASLNYSYYLSLFNFMIFSYSFFYILNCCIQFYKNF